MELFYRLFKLITHRQIVMQRQSREDHTPDRGTVELSLKENLAKLQTIFSKAPDLIIRTFIYKQTGQKAALVYLCGLVDKNSINNNVLYQLMFEPIVDNEQMSHLPITVGDLKSTTQWSNIELMLLEGHSILFLDGAELAYSLDTQGWPQRAISDSQIEASLKGSHQGFIESGWQNVALIRRLVSTRELKMVEMYIGSRVPCKVTILYMEDLTQPDLLQELEKRLKALNVDCILNTGELAEYLEDRPFSLFPQFITTERPDTAASQLLQGRLCLVVDRSSSVLIAPVGVAAFFQGVDDYSTRWPIATFLRIMRFIACFVAAFLPGIYIACISFNVEVIPLDLILSIGQFRASVPFPPFIEALIMEMMLEMLREAGVRLPAPVGQTVGIVGGIVIGQAAVQAGIVSNLMVVVVSSTAVASFILPNYDMAASIRLIRFPVMLIASLFGIIGIVACFMGLLIHVIQLKSLGESYSTPLAPMRLGDWKDVFVRMPLWSMKKRPDSIRTLQKTRIGPKRSKGDEE
ncbi:spore germination protein [Paenibacillus sp. OV219]|uniref:spore germination protein n=1 Tax=Paenibacillus sp. OV219 TaxID=1884377 RepID=UPI0008D5DB72|nr:spore germination protein [Paenibacillus sp. OV219]SEM90990.1 spore germination protein [Paenibacillus sp. OV219]